MVCWTGKNEQSVTKKRRSTERRIGSIDQEVRITEQQEECNEWRMTGGVLPMKYEGLTTTIPRGPSHRSEQEERSREEQNDRRPGIDKYTEKNRQRVEESGELKAENIEKVAQDLEQRVTNGNPSGEGNKLTQDTGQELLDGVKYNVTHRHPWVEKRSWMHRLENEK